MTNKNLSQCICIYMNQYNGCVAQHPYHDWTYYQPNVMLVRPFVLTKVWFVKKYFLHNFNSIEQKWLYIRRYWIMFYFKVFNRMITLICWRLKWEDNLLFSFLICFTFFAMESDKTNSEIRFPIVWLPHNDISFLLQIFDKKNYTCI